MFIVMDTCESIKNRSTKACNKVLINNNMNYAKKVLYSHMNLLTSYVKCTVYSIYSRAYL